MSRTNCLFALWTLSIFALGVVFGMMLVRPSDVPMVDAVPEEHYIEAVDWIDCGEPLDRLDIK